MRLILFLILNLLISSQTFSQVLSKWTFEGITLSGTASTSPSLSNGAVAANEGALKAGSEFSGNHASASSWTTPQGNGSSQSLSATKWAANDYFQFKGSTKGYKNITIKFDVTGSDTGPRDFKLQYSTDNVSYTDADTYAVTNDNWSASVKPVSARTVNLANVAALNDKDYIYIRLVATGSASVSNGTIGTAGTSRVDNFTIEAESTLPLSLSSFTATRSANSIDLTWKTNAEVNSSYFSILKSVDGKSFQEIGKVHAAGTSQTEKNYSFRDLDVRAGAVYYQLVSFNGDVTAVSSGIIFCGNSDKAGLTIDLAGFTSTNLELLVRTDEAVQAQLSLRDINGSTLYSANVELKVGTNTFLIPRQGEAKLLIASMKYRNKKISKKLIIN